MSQFSKKINLPYLCTFDDVLLLPAKSDILPHETNLTTKFTRNHHLHIPLVSAAMDTVTESQMSIQMAQEGGMGVIHKNLSIENQVLEVNKVKKYEAGMILSPICVNSSDSLEQVLNLKVAHGFSGFPVLDENKKVIGIITNRDIRFENNKKLKVQDLMTKNPITISEGTNIEEAKKLLHKHRIEKLPVVNHQGNLLGLLTIRDIEQSILYPLANKDQYGRLKVAAAIGVGDRELERADELVKIGVDILVIDTAHGHSTHVQEMLKKIKAKKYSVDVIVGNVATVNAAQELIDLGADAIKVGVGPGSICTTRIVAGIGVPQLSALLAIGEICRKQNVPMIADGGIKFSGDIVKALAAGAHTVMIGSLFAGTDASPGEMVLYQGRAYKTYRGMGSLESMKRGSKDRYGQASILDVDKFVPEGIEGQVPYRGPLKETIYQLLGGLKSGMGYIGAKDLNALYEKAEFIPISASTIKENHPHDVMITKDAPNYQMRGY